MKALIIPKADSSYYNNAVIIDYKTCNVEFAKRVETNIFRMYVADEDMEIRFTNGNNKQTVLKANKDDIVLVFYKGAKNEVVIVKNKEWKDNIIYAKAEEAKNQIDKEAWAECNKDCGSCMSTSCGC